MNQSLHLASGQIRNLTVSNEHRNIVFSGNQSSTAKGLGVAAAAAGMAAEAAQISSTGDTEELLEVYQFELGGERFCGYARVADFKDGDFIEVVYEKCTPEHNALAVRRPSTRNIWVQHFMSKGTYAGVLHAIKLWLLFSSGVAAFIFIFTFSLDLIFKGWDGAIDSTTSFALNILPKIFLMPLVVVPFIAPRFFRRAKKATAIFKKFGFKNPRWMDLDKTSRMNRLSFHELTDKFKDVDFRKRSEERTRNDFRYWY